jgi:Protein of unknown function (DUF433)
MQDRIAVDPDVMLGKPVIRGTRITVELILRKLSEGASEAELLEAYPHLTAQIFAPPSSTHCSWWSVVGVHVLAGNDFRMARCE